VSARFGGRSEPSAEAAKQSPKHSPSTRFGGGGELCTKCGKTVYAAERATAQGKVYHTDCMRCVSCKVKLGNTFCADDLGTLFCKAHFMQSSSAHRARLEQHDGEIQQQTPIKPHAATGCESGGAVASVAEAKPKAEAVEVGRRRRHRDAAKAPERTNKPLFYNAPAAVAMAAPGEAALVKDCVGAPGEAALIHEGTIMGALGGWMGGRVVGSVQPDVGQEQADSSGAKEGTVIDALSAPFGALGSWMGGGVASVMGGGDVSSKKVTKTGERAPPMTRAASFL
jgi:hypothetical protein